MEIWMINELVFFDENDKIAYLEHGKVYEIPDYWAKIITKEGAGAEYVRIKLEVQQ